MTLTVGIDIGGTKIAAGVVDPEGSILAEVRRESPAQDAAEIAADIGVIVADFVSSYQISAVGVAAAGFIDVAGENVMFAPNVAWRDEPLRARVAERTGLPVVLENDANAAVWGEYRFGAGRGAGTLAMVAIGTGIGGGIVHHGALFRGGFGVAAEFGHLRVVPDGRPCACGLRGCWEAYGSGTGLAVRARELAAADPDRAAILLDLVDGDVSAIRGPQVSQAAEAGDPAALESFADLARWIGEGMGSLVAILDPDVIVLGGGVAESPALELDPVVRAFRGAVTGSGHRPEPPIRRAALGNRAGLIGAADLAQRLVASPAPQTL